MADLVDSNNIEATTIKNYQPGEIIVKEGASNEFFYVILQGEIQIYQMNKPIRILGDRDVFGLENYFRDRGYSTTAKATNASRVATYKSNLIEDIASSKPGLMSMILKSTYLQLEQTTSVAEQNIPYAETINLDFKEYNDGDVIIKEGASGTEVYKLHQAEGGLDVSKKGVQIGKIVKSGEYFGEMSFILNEPRTATVKSIGKNVVEIIPVQEGGFEALVYENPDIALKIITTLSHRLRQTNLRVVK
ncbi:MAG: cyclic nucleotide-binding domain-containing protein [Thermodesulfobacteriota bacterium]|nr:cyclic nucleotide-binding domain-containing protein [Thermodesulfobacteriota bacterium]